MNDHSSLQPFRVINAGINAGLALLLTTASVHGQDGSGDVSTLRQDTPSFLVRAEVNRESRDYREGDTFSLKVVSEKDAYLYVIYQQADGATYQVFPNSAQPDNRIRAKQAVQIPAEDDLFRWRIAAPFGTETVKVIAAEQPLKGLSDPRLRSKRFNPVSSEVVKGISLELGAETPDQSPTNNGTNNVPVIPVSTGVHWAECEITVTTYPRNQELEASGAKRFGVFFGVSEHKYALLQELFSGSNSNLSSPHRDARYLAEQLNDIGDLNGSRVYTNDKATRANLEEAITKWLPEKSRPGDTVIIYFSGHGGQIPDDNGDESDHEDEFLIPNDYFGLAELLGLLKQAKEGNVQESLRSLLEFGRRLLQRVSAPEKASELLARSTGVTDDLFGHWLQSLDDRQVIVILDICHAGGFSTQEKDIDETERPAKGFDFLDREVSRLKDIGQGNIVLLTSSTTEELSLVRPDGELSVMTYHLLNVLKEARGPLDIDTAYERVKAQMQAYFESEEFLARNRERKKPAKPHHPVLYKQTTERVWLKP
ncbi:DUF4384 domain-containing protein [bacterium]|nr:DUF4384 domain-containing protein [bacterium]